MKSRVHLFAFAFLILALLVPGLRPHFAKAGKIEIRWPSGIRQTLENVSVGQFLRVVEPNK